MNSITAITINGFQRKRKVSKVMEVFFQIIHIVFALDFGFLKPKSKMIKWLLHIWSVIKFSILSILTVHNLYLYNGSLKTLWFFFNLLSYICAVSILSLSKADVTFCNLHSDLRLIDTELKVTDSVYNLEFKIVLSLFFCFANRTIFTLGYCTFSEKCLKPYWASFIFLSVMLSLEICHVCYTFIFISANCRLKPLISALNMAEPNFTSLQRIYKSLIDITEKYKSAFDPLVSISRAINY